MVRDLLRGFSAPFRAIRLLAGTAKLRRLAVMPFLVNVVVFAIGVPLMIWLGISFVGDLIPDSGVWQGALRVLLQIVVTLAVLVGSVFGFAIVGNIIAAPFNSKLSEAVEQHLTGSVTPNESVVGDVVRGVMTAIGRLLLFLVFYPPVFALQFIPVAGPFLHPIVAALYGAFVLSLDFSDPTFERHFQRFRPKLGFIWTHKALYLGFGLTAVAMAIIPIVNFLLLPVCVTAAAMMYLEEVRSQ